MHSAIFAGHYGVTGSELSAIVALRCQTRGIWRVHYIVKRLKKCRPATVKEVKNGFNRHTRVHKKETSL